MTTPQTIIAALSVVGVRCSQEMAERVLEDACTIKSFADYLKPDYHSVEEYYAAKANREAIIETVIGSQALSGVTISRETAEASVDQAYAKPLIDL